MRARTAALFLCLCLLCGGLFGTAAAACLARQMQRQQAALIAALDAGNSVPAALHRAPQTDPASGLAVMARYGYTSRRAFRQLAPPLAALGAALFCVSGAAVCVILRRRDRRLQARLDGLTDYLAAFHTGIPRVLLRAEDECARLEDEIYKTVSALRLAREQAVAERQILADDLADIAHQIKTPLTSMRLMTELLSRADPEDAACIDRLTVQNTRLEALVTSLLTLSRLDAGAVVFQPQEICLYELVRRAAEPVDAMLDKKGISLTVMGDAQTAACLDIIWTAEAVLNLLKNCAEHTPSGGTITVECADNPIFASLRITDSGPGFDPDDLPHLFERFYRGKTAAKDSIGIGLALARTILMRQNGSVIAQCAPQGGAQFEIKLYHGRKT